MESWENGSKAKENEGSDDWKNSLNGYDGFEAADSVNIEAESIKEDNKVVTIFFL